MTIKKSQKLVEIEEIEHDSGEFCYHYDIGELEDEFKGGISVGPIRDPFSCIILILNELGYLENEDVEAYSRLTCEEHMEAIDENIIIKIKEGLKLADNIRNNYYKSLK